MEGYLKIMDIERLLTICNSFTFGDWILLWIVSTIISLMGLLLYKLCFDEQFGEFIDKNIAVTVFQLLIPIIQLLPLLFLILYFICKTLKFLFKDLIIFLKDEF